MLACVAKAQTAAPPAAQPAAAIPTAKPDATPVLLPSTVLSPPPRGDAARQLPIVLQAARISSQADLATVAEGDVEFRRGGLLIRADSLRYDSPQDLATARGRVRVSRDGALYSGPELSLNVQRFEGYFSQPTFEFYRLGAGGSADRVELLGESRARAVNAQYTSCPRDSGDEPAWVLKLQSLDLDFQTQVGVAEGAVLRFLGTPILALPALSFPLGDARKSGWLPPNVSIDNRSGIEIAAPYYWNIAPQRDATFSPRVITRRGLALDTEFRYLEPRFEGQLALDWLPNDRVAKRSRQAVQWLHVGRLGDASQDQDSGQGLRYRAELLRVSDDDWWKDFPNAGRSFTTRLLPSRLALEKPFAWAAVQGLIYARLLQWQVLQGSNAPIAAPYQRSPQVGYRLTGSAGPVQYALESEFNRFTLPQGELAKAGRAEGDRLHALGSLSLPYRVPGGWVVPRLAFNAARYSGMDGAFGVGNVLKPGAPLQASRVIPSFSIDAGLELERNTQAFGRDLHQTLEPRVLYVNTPFRAQSQYPVYDAAAKDFNFVSLYTDNAFSGIDRVSDSHQITAGVTTRLVDAASGAEALRLGLVQRYLLRTQRVTAQPDGTPDGAPLEQRFSDALLLGSTSVLPGWTLDAAVQYSADISRSVRSIVGARYAPAPFRTVGGTYRLARGSSEQFEVGWQWPVWGPERPATLRGGASAVGSCTGTLYSVGRVNYSIKDSRVTDSVLGLEYDAGCWIGRVVATRLSTGSSEATTRLGIQLELTGLSKLNLGANPLKVLKDNIPGFRLLRDDPQRGAETADWQPAP